ncbi:MAG: hypothetical protein WC236_07220 [Gallionellaceae bacterium]|jgi:hypothetical protein
MTDCDQSELSVTVVHDHDGECSVTFMLKSGAFQGLGRAWLDIDDVSAFVASTKTLADTSAGEASLRGGYFDKDGTPNFTVNLSLRPHGTRGHILVSSELASDLPNESSTSQSVSRVSAALVVEPAALARFANRLSSIPKGAEVAATVPGEGAV